MRRLKMAAAGLAALAGALCASSAALAAEGPYRVFDVSEPQTTIVDTLSVTHKGAGGRLRTVEVFKEVQKIEGVDPFFFIVAVEEIDCSGGRLRGTHLAALDKAGAQIWDGGESPNAEWEVQEKGTLGAAKIDLVCKGTWPPGGATYATVTQAREGLYKGY